MSLIVAGRFTSFSAAESAARHLFAEGFLEEDVHLFFVNPRGQHCHVAADTLRSVPFTARAAKHPGRDAIIGAVTGAVVGVTLFSAISSSAIVAVLAAGVGAYVGAMIGATIEARMRASPPIDTLVRHAVHHETRDSTGRWKEGHWADFDPTKAPELLSETQHRQA
jgi:uncharacterized protein YcfJ